MVASILNQQQQQKLTPEAVLSELKAGNERFVSNNLNQWDFPKQLSECVSGQFPKAVVLSCIDSRVPVEYIFDQSIGDIFVARVAGNVLNEDILGSIEFATQVSGAKLILVLGHESCGAVKSAIDKVKLGHITGILDKIQPAIESSENFSGEKLSSNQEYVSHVAIKNIEYTISQIASKSSIIKELEENNAVKIVGGMYRLKTGEVTFLD